MKKLVSFLSILLLLIATISAIEQFNAKYDHPAINICFSKSLTGNNNGAFSITNKDGMVVTPFTDFNLLSEKYQIISLKQLYRVKDREWQKNGIYPMNIFQIKVKDENQLNNLIKELSTKDYLIFAEFDPILKADLITNDVLVQSQWALYNIDAFRAWDYETGNAETIIGIVDSGVKWNHPDLKNNMWINQPEMAGVTINWAAGTFSGGDGIDNDGNGYVDDVFGWDFWETEGEEDNNPYQSFGDNNHGTHVAGCAAAVGNNNIGVAGPAFNARIMATKHQPSNQTTNSIFNGYGGVYYCADSGADIINCSWGGRGGSNTAETAASYALDHGALMFCAASNDDTDNTYVHYYPSDASDAVSVAATDNMDKKASFSNYGIPVDISAPGVSINSTVFNMEGNDAYSSFSGTSMATPISSGVAGLIKSMHPELTPTQLRARIIAGCDSIDAINPQYAGKLGAGRVNAYNSLMYDKIPNLSIVGYQVDDTAGDHDGMVNPGETISLNVQLKNKTGWMPCQGLTARLRTTDPGITIIDSVFTINTIDPGQAVFSTQSLTFTVSPNFPVISQLPLFIDILSNTSSAYPYHVQMNVSIPVTLIQQNWPLTLENSTVYSSLAFDMNNDNEKEILFTSNDGKVHLVDKNKNYLPGFPVDLNETIYSSPSLIEINQQKQIVVTSIHKIVKISLSGQILSNYSTEGVLRATPVIADINNDGHAEIIVGALNKKLYVLNNNGTTLYNGFPLTLSGSIVSPVAVADMNNDDLKDILVSTSDGYIHMINSATGQQANGWPYYFGSLMLNGPVVVQDENQSLLLITGNKGVNNRFVVLNQNGQSQMTKPLPSGVLGNPVVGDVNNDGETDVAFADNAGNVYLMNLGGTLHSGFPVALSCNIEPSCLLGDLNGDSISEIIVTTNNGKIYAINHQGQILPSFPIVTNSFIKYSPVLTSIDNDNDADLIFSYDTNLSIIDFKIPFGTVKWGMYRLNQERNAVVFASTAGANDIIIPVNKEIMTIYPNPFNPTTTISFDLLKDQKVKLEIYNIKGQRVKSFKETTFTKGKNKQIWNGDNDHGQECGAGIYFVRLKTDSGVLTSKALLLK